MGSLAGCLKRVGISGPEEEHIRRLVKQYRDDGVDGPTANVKAVQQLIRDTDAERKSVLAQVEALQPKKEEKVPAEESAIDKALRSVGVDPNAPPDPAKALRREADRLTKSAMADMGGIAGGQPVRSTSDRNRRDKALEKQRKASELIIQAEAIEQAHAAMPGPSKEPAKSEPPAAPAESPTAILTAALRQAADQIEGKPLGLVNGNILRSPMPMVKNTLPPEKLDEGTPLFERREEPVPTFFSHVERVLEQKMPNRASFEQIKGILSPNNGVKPDELKWLGLDDYLKTKDYFTKEDVLNFVKENQVTVQEVTKGERRELTDAEANERTRLGLTGKLTQKQKDRYAELSEIQMGSPTKFASYQTPGGTNYRELLLTLPFNSKVPTYEAWKDHLEFLGDKPENMTREKYDEEVGFYGKRGTYDKGNVFTSSHFSEPNILAHVRFNDRTSADGKKVLFLEEVQSDWHQKGKREGYKVSPERAAQLEKRRVELERAGRKATPEEKQAWVDVMNELQPDNTARVPDAPFKKTWPELAMKRMLRYAAEHGYDELAWTTGAQQIDRYWNHPVVSAAVERFADATKPESIRELGEYIFGGKMAALMPLNVVDGGMLAALKNNKVYQHVISSLPIDVMDILRAAQLSPKNLFRKQDVVFDTLSVDSRRRVADGVLSTLRDTGTTIRTKLEGLRLGGGEISLLPTVKASDLKAREVAGLLSPQSIFHFGADGAPEKGASTGAIAKALAAEHGRNFSDKLGATKLAEFLNAHVDILQGQEGIVKQGFEAPPGEGMKGFYDQILPTFLNKTGKKWGAKVGEMKIDLGPRDYEKFSDQRSDLTDAQLQTAFNAPHEQTVHSLPITDSMKVSVMTEGQPLFQKNRDRQAPTMRQFNQAIDAGASIGNTEQKVIDSSQQYPDGMIEELASKPYVRRISVALKDVFGEISATLSAADREFGSPSFIGLSPDDYYGGVNLRGPDEIIINPWVTLWRVDRHIKAGEIAEDKRTRHLASVLLRTLLHEMTHQQVVTDHEEGTADEVAFDQQLAQNYTVLGRATLQRLHQQLIDTLGGDTDAIASDLRGQRAFWRRGDGLSRQRRSRYGQPDTEFDRSNVAGEGTSGRTGPPTNLRRRGERETSALDESPEFQRRDEPAGGSGSYSVAPAVARERLAAAKTSARPYLLGALGLQQIADVYGRDHHEVSTYNTALQTMQADFVQTTQTSDKILKDWDKLKVPVADQMAKVMEDARFANFDPDPETQQAALTPAQIELKQRFAALPDEAKAIYRQAREFYSTMAKSRFEAIQDRIDRAGVSPLNRRRMKDELSTEYEKTKSKVYFPFTRFGDYVVVANKFENNTRVDHEVHTFESVGDANKFAMQMKARGWKVKQTTAKAYSRDKDGAASAVVQRMMDILQGIPDEPGLPGMISNKAQLFDSLNQSFLQALPDMSYAKHFIHAKEVKGASRDALRSFAHSALHGAHHISRIRFADRLSQAVMDLDTRINETEEGDVSEARQVYNELVQRHNTILNPNTHPFSAWLGQLGFTMSLGGVVATGVTNMTQVPLITLPWLGSRYGFGKSTAALAKAYKDFLDPATLNKDSLFDASKSDRLTQPERTMLEALQKRGRIDMTQTMDLSGRASQDNLSRVAKQTGSIQSQITKMLGFTFHAPEVANRQVTAIATFRLAKAAGATDGEAMLKAEQAIVDTHFIYSTENRARYMSGNVLRILTMFKQYSANVAYLYGRSAAVWLDSNNATPEERKIAKKQLLSMAALQFAAAGALGMPFVGTIASLFTAVLNGFGDDDDKWDWEVELRKFLADQFGKQAGEVLSHGLSRLTPWDMATRLGQSDLFFRAPSREREGRAAAMDWVTSFAGPVLGYAVNSYLGVGDLVKGIKDADAGKFLRGTEELVPSVLRHAVKTLRYQVEGGVRTRDSIKQLDVNYAEKLGQFFGFGPSRAAEMYEGANAIKNTEHQLTQRRKELLDQYASAIQDRNTAARADVLADVRSFNAKHPEMRINGDTLMRSMKGRQQREKGTQGGIYLPRKREPLRQRGDFANY